MDEYTRYFDAEVKFNEERVQSAMMARDKAHSKLAKYKRKTRAKLAKYKRQTVSKLVNYKRQMKALELETKELNESISRIMFSIRNMESQWNEQEEGVG